jgi:hypothetical protein
MVKDLICKAVSELQISVALAEGSSVVSFCRLTPATHFYFAIKLSGRYSNGMLNVAHCSETLLKLKLGSTALLLSLGLFFSLPNLLTTDLLSVE